MFWIQEHFIEIFGAITGIIYVFLEIKRNIWLWPLGIVTSSVYIYVFYHSGFYADMGLQWYYLFISVYGWIIWSRAKKIKNAGSREQGAGSREQRRGREEKEIVISNIKYRQIIVLSLITGFLFVGIWYILTRFTDSTIPGWDAFTTALSITATWMLARKIIEHWYLWIAVNIVSVGLYIYKGLYPTVFLFVVYAVMAVVGYIEWRKYYGKGCSTG